MDYKEIIWFAKENRAPCEMQISINTIKSDSEFWEAIGNNIDWACWLSLQRWITDDVFYKLFALNNSDVYDYLAGNRYLPPIMFDKLFGLNDKNINSILASNLNLLIPMFRKLSKLNDFYVNHRLRCNPSVPQSIKDKLKGK